MEQPPAISPYSMQVRLLLCQHCGAPLDVALAGGATRCSFCAAENQLVARTALPAFAPPARARLSEDERRAQLESQDHQPLLPPSAVAELLGPGGDIPAFRQQDALAAWQSARKRTSEQSLEAAAELIFLTMALGNQFAASQDWTRHRAMLESALEAFFLPRHRSSMAANLCSGACRQGDLEGAETWLGLCDPASDDLLADSEYRIASARVSRLKQDFHGVLELLGQTAAEVPIHGAIDGVATVERAHAWERIDRIDAAVRELTARMARGPQARAGIESIIAIHGLCPASFALALAQTKERSANLAARTASGGLDRHVKTGKLLLGLGAGCLAVAIAALITSRVRPAAGDLWTSPAGITLLVGGGVGLMLLIVGTVALGIGKPMLAAAAKARHLALHGKSARGTVLSVTNTGMMEGSATQVRVRLRVELSGITPYEAETTIIVTPTDLGDLAQGNRIFLRVDPDKPQDIAPEA